MENWILIRKLLLSNIICCLRCRYLAVFWCKSKEYGGSTFTVQEQSKWTAESKPLLTTNAYGPPWWVWYTYVWVYIVFFKLNFSRMKQVEVLTNRKWRSQEHVADIFMLFIFKGSNLFCLDNIDIKQLDTYRMLL